jgi:hypothetical protein
MIGFVQIIGFAVICMVLTEFMVQGVKEWLPNKIVGNLEKAWAFFFSLFFVFAPKLVQLPTGGLPTSIVESYTNLAAMPWTFCLLLGVLISRGSSAFYALMKRLGISTPISDRGEVQKLLYAAPETQKATEENVSDPVK